MDEYPLASVLPLPRTTVDVTLEAIETAAPVIPGAPTAPGVDANQGRSLPATGGSMPIEIGAVALVLAAAALGLRRRATPS